MNAISEIKKTSRGATAADVCLSARHFRQVADILHQETGIYLAESKTLLVQSRLAKRLRALGMSSFSDYCDLISRADGIEERGHMMASLTTNVTSFFREPHHFEHLKSSLLPPLLAAARNGARVRIWSAACSNGSEPYSIALTVLALMPEAAQFDIKILATDIDPNMIAQARLGQYGPRTVAHLPPGMKSQHFNRQSSGDWSIGDAPRSLVTFRELNLMQSWPIKGPFQAIFCRNVVIYFQEDTQQKIWSRFAPLLAPGGWLFIGHSERVTGPAAKVFENEGVTSYRRT